MIQNVLTNIGGIGIYGVVSICLFVAIFVAVTIWLLCLDKSYLDSMPTLPLENDRPPKTNPDNDPNPADP